MDRRSIGWRFNPSRGDSKTLVAQLVERGPSKPMVVGSTPSESIFFLTSLGIPHPEGPFIYGENVDFTLCEKNKSLMKRLIQWMNEPSRYLVPTDIIGKRFYMYYTEDGEIIFTKNMNHSLIKKMMERKGELACYFGGMKKTLIQDNGAPLSITPTAVKRVVCLSSSIV